MKNLRKAAVAALAVVALAVCLVPVVGTVTAQPAYAKISNTKAHSLYKSYLRGKMSDAMSFGKYKFIDITGDGVDEMISEWWPSVCTIKSGKVKVLLNADVGSCSYFKVYKKKHVVVYRTPDHMGASSYDYYKWNKTKKKFVLKASTYTPTSAAKSMGFTSCHTVNGKQVSKSKFKAYKKKLLGSAKATTIKYSQL